LLLIPGAMRVVVRMIRAEVGMDVREALWLIGLALVGYSVWQFFRALRAPRTGAVDAGTAAAADAAEAIDERATLQRGAAPQRVRADEEDEDAFLDYAPLPGPQADSGPAPEPSAPLSGQPDVFQLQLDNSRLRQALQAQRDLVALQQDEIDRLVQDITTLQDELDRLREQPTSSPEYSEALVLATQGLNAEMIAARCGITLAEAELVLSMARRDEGTA
jgi:hypothetical protein